MGKHLEATMEAERETRKAKHEPGALEKQIAEWAEQEGVELMEMEAGASENNNNGENCARETR